MPRAPKHEPAIAQTEALLRETAETVDCPHFFRDVQHVIDSLRKTRPKETPLALHFIGIAVGELLDKRGDGAKVCLLLAEGLAEQKLRHTLLKLFCAVFHRNEPCGDGPADTATELAAKMAETFSNSFDQIVEAIQNGGGVVKLSLKKPVNKSKTTKSLPPVNPWN